MFPRTYGLISNFENKEAFVLQIRVIVWVKSFLSSCQLVQYSVVLTCLIDFTDFNPLVNVIKAPWPQNRLFSSKNSDRPDDQNIYRYIIQGSCLVQP